MVLQCDKPVVVWGTAEPGEKVSVRFAGQEKSVVTDASNHPTLQYPNLLVGEVWFAGGQSNRIHR